MLKSVRNRLQKKSHQASPTSFFGSDLEILEQNKNSCSWPNIYYGNIDLLAKMVGAETILEVGVAWGYHAEHLLLNLPSITYTGIDPYLSGYDKNDGFAADVAELFKDDEQSSMDRLYEAVKLKLIEKFPGRATLVREKSTDWMDKDSNTFDVIFLDGDHTFETVRKELSSFWTKVNEGGILAGDDYDWPEVKKAVDEFANEKKLQIKFLSKESRGYPTYFFLK
jgi:predicted O-methyltransferase YrrM